MSSALWNIVTGVVYLFFCLGLGLGGRLSLGRLCRRGFGRRRLCFSLRGCGSNRSLCFSLGCRLLGLTSHSLQTFSVVAPGTSDIARTFLAGAFLADTVFFALAAGFFVVVAFLEEPAAGFLAGTFLVEGVEDFLAGLADVFDVLVWDLAFGAALVVVVVEMCFCAVEGLAAALGLVTPVVAFLITGLVFCH